MKNSFFKILASITLIGLIVACDTVEEPYIEGNPYSGVYDSDLPIRKILLEDFTGFGCVNCPRANEEIHKLQERYGNHIVPIAIHSGWFANPVLSSDPDYITDVGLELGGDGKSNATMGFFEVSNQPVGVINRISIEDDFKIEHEEWSSKIVEILSINKFADISIAIENTYNADTREVEIAVNSKAINSVEANLSLSVYVVENEVIGKQKDGSEVIEDYEHNHMLRAGVNGTWGDEISASAAFDAGSELEETYTYTLNEEWNENHCEIVAFIYNTETKEVIQAEKMPVVSE